MIGISNSLHKRRHCNKEYIKTTLFCSNLKAIFWAGFVVSFIIVKTNSPNLDQQEQWSYAFLLFLIFLKEVLNNLMPHFLSFLWQGIKLQQKCKSSSRNTNKFRQPSDYHYHAHLIMEKADLTLSSGLFDFSGHLLVMVLLRSRIEHWGSKKKKNYKYIKI